MQERPLHHGQRQVGREAAIREELRPQRRDLALGSSGDRGIELRRQHSVRHAPELASVRSGSGIIRHFPRGRGEVRSALER